MLIIPAGTPHKWEKSDEFTYYVVVRADPKGVAPCWRWARLSSSGRTRSPRPTQKEIAMRKIILGAVGLAPCAAVFARKWQATHPAS
jgi:hypothetical protein